MTRRTTVTRTVVTLGALITAAAVMVHGSFHHATSLQTPASLIEDHSLWGSRIRLVGVVRAHSLKQGRHAAHFAVRDKRDPLSVVVSYNGVVPDQPARRQHRRGNGNISRRGVPGRAELAAGNVREQAV